MCQWPKWHVHFFLENTLELSFKLDYNWQPHPTKVIQRQIEMLETQQKYFMSCDIEFQRERKNYNYAQIGLIGHFQVKLVCIFTAKRWLKEADDIQSKKLFMALIAYMEKHKMILVQKIVEEEVPKKSSLSLLIGFSKFVIEKVQGSRVKVTLPAPDGASLNKKTWSRKI